MNRQLIPQVLHTVRFRQWSRKGYSMFCSLHRHVTIGQVSKGIADSSLGKSNDIVWVEWIQKDECQEDVALSPDDGQKVEYAGCPTVWSPVCGKILCVPCENKYYGITTGTAVFMGRRCSNIYKVFDIVLYVGASPFYLRWF